VKKLSKTFNEIQSTLTNTEKMLHVNQEDLKSIVKDLRICNKIHEDLNYTIKLHQSGSVVTVAKEYKAILRDLNTIKKEISEISRLKTKLEKTITKLIGIHEEYTEAYEEWFIYSKQKNIIPFKK